MNTGYENAAEEVLKFTERLKENLAAADKAKLFDLIKAHHPKEMPPLEIPEESDRMAMHNFIFMYPKALFEFEVYLKEKYKDPDLENGILCYLMSKLLGIVFERNS